MKTKTEYLLIIFFLFLVKEVKSSDFLPNEYYSYHTYKYYFGLDLLNNDNLKYNELLKQINFNKNFSKYSMKYNFGMGMEAKPLVFCIFYYHITTEKVNEDNLYDVVFSRNGLGFSMGYQLNILKNFAISPKIGGSITYGEFQILRNNIKSIDFNDFFKNQTSKQSLDAKSYDFDLGIILRYNLIFSEYKDPNTKDLIRNSIAFELSAKYLVYSIVDSWKMGTVNITGMPDYLQKGFSIGLNVGYEIFSAFKMPEM
jgi:hypothetical protein